MVSIIVPVYNCEKAIRKCIDSLVNQTYEDIEIVLVDDGTPDNSGRICDEYAQKDSRIKVLHKENGGVSSARNAGLDIATGEYVQFVDSDDYIELTLVEDFMKAVKTGAQIAMCGRTEIRGGKTRIIATEEKDKFCIKDIYEKCPILFSEYIINSPCNKLYKKEYIDFRFDESLSLGEDLLFNLKYLKKINSVSLISGGPYYYIEQEQSLTKKVRKDAQEIANRLYDECMKFIEHYDLGDNAKKDVGGIFIRPLLWHLYNIYLEDKNSKEEITKWVNNSSVQMAVRYSNLNSKFQKITAKIIAKKNISSLMVLFGIKKAIRR